MTIEELLKALGIADDKKETAEKELKSFWTVAMCRNLVLMK